MKCKTCMILALAMMVFSVGGALADEFTLHSNVTFGMSKEEVSALEQSAGFDLTDMFGTTENAPYGEGKIAGRDGTGISYFFDSENELFRCRYWFRLRNTGFSQHDYDGLDNALINKYGETPYNSQTGNAIPITDDTLKNVTSNNNIYDFSPVTYKSINKVLISCNTGAMGMTIPSKVLYDVKQFSQWLVLLDDGSGVVIEHSYIVLNKQNYMGTKPIGDVKTEPLEMIVYSKITAEQVAAIGTSQQNIADDL